MSRLYDIIDKMIEDMKDPVKIAYEDGLITRTAGSKVTLTAPEVPGYTFLMWVNSGTHGWFGATYFETPDNPTTNVWLVATNSGSTTPSTVRGWALYVKDELISA